MADKVAVWLADSLAVCLPGWERGIIFRCVMLFLPPEGKKITKIFWSMQGSTREEEP